MIALKMSTLEDKMRFRYFADRCLEFVRDTLRVLISLVSYEDEESIYYMRYYTFQQCWFTIAQPWNPARSISWPSSAGRRSTYKTSSLRLKTARISCEFTWSTKTSQSTNKIIPGPPRYGSACRSCATGKWRWLKSVLQRVPTQSWVSVPEWLVCKLYGSNTHSSSCDAVRKCSSKLLAELPGFKSAVFKGVSSARLRVNSSVNAVENINLDHHPALV